MTQTLNIKYFYIQIHQLHPNSSLADLYLNLLMFTCTTTIWCMPGYYRTSSFLDRARISHMITSA